MRPDFKVSFPQGKVHTFNFFKHALNMTDPEVWTTDDDVTSATTPNNDVRNSSDNKLSVMALLSCIITSIGIVSNPTVITAFLNHKKLRRKIPTMFIINQVGFWYLVSSEQLSSRTSFRSFGHLQ